MNALKRQGWIGIKWAFMITMIILLVFPFFIMLITSLKTKSDVYDNLSILPTKWMFSNYVDIWKQVDLFPFFMNSLKISVGSMVLVLLIAIPAAYALSRMKMYGKNAILSLLLIIQMFSPIVILVPLYKMFASYHMLDNLWSLVIVNSTFSISFAVWFIRSFFNSVPVDIDEAAQIDGCNRFQAMIWVVAPLSGPAIATSAIFTFINAWNEFLFALTFIQTDTKMPLTVGLFSFAGRYDVQWHYMMGAALLSSIPVLVLFLLIHKHLVNQLMTGSVK
ncbi:MAG: transporter permease [Cohnella sp.]|jgi:multiple sugar transport system permease protein|nr:transporter permease [Cohnella sp.]